MPLSNPPSRQSRILRGLVCAVLGLLIAFLALLLVPGFSMTASDVVQRVLLGSRSEKDFFGLGGGMLAGAAGLAGVLGWLGFKLRWRALAGVSVVVIAIYCWLATDDRQLHRERTMESLFPAYPAVEARASYEVLMRYGKLHPAGRDFQGSTFAWTSTGADKPEEWVKYLAAHRGQIEADWAALAPVRAWWTELNTFEHIVDLMPPRLDGEIIAFRPIRELSQRTCAIASLQAIDGQGDAAMETLRPLLEVSRKLQETGRSLVLQMLSVVVERMAMETAGFVLDRTSVSAPVRARFAAALDKPGGGEAGARRLLAGESILGQNTILGAQVGGIIETEQEFSVGQGILNAIDPFIYLPRATANLFTDFMSEAEDLIGRRKLKEYDALAEKFLAENSRPGFKNMGGQLLVVYMTPAYGKIAVSYWKVQDNRAALLARLHAPITRDK